jgi:protein-S-isoprenylcysteine O-methyltransferase Ste14
MLWLRGVIFTVLVPCMVGAYVPSLIYRGRELEEGFWVIDWKVGQGIGWLLVGLGATIYLVCLVAFLSAGGTPAMFFTRPLKFILGEEPPRLVRQGLYRFSRNPMYVGVVMAVFGQALICGSSSVAGYGAFLWLCFHTVVVFLEEPHLREERGPSYDEYRRKVPRWIGWPRG